MPTVLYRWDFETGDTQGWTIVSDKATLNSSSVIQGVYSIRYYLSVLERYASVTEKIMYISNIDLSTASRPRLIFLLKLCSGMTIDVIVNVYDSGGSLLLTRRARMGVDQTIIKAVVIDLTPVAGMSGLKIEIEHYVYNGGYGGAPVDMYYDNIYIVDGGDREYDISVLALNNTDRTLTYSIPDAERSLPSGIARLAVNLTTPPHPLNEGSDIFTYTAITDTASVSMTSTDAANKHAVIATPTTAPSYINEFRVRVYPKTAGTTWYAFDETVVVTFWSTAWDLVYVIVFRVAITINPYSPTYATAMINTTYGSTWSGQREFTLKVHARSLGIRCYVRYLVGDNTIVQAGTVKVEVFSEDYSFKYGESSVDLTTGTTLRGATITGLPTDTTLKLRISWSIAATARVVLEARPEFLVY